MAITMSTVSAAKDRRSSLVRLVALEGVRLVKATALESLSDNATFNRIGDTCACLLRRKYRLRLIVRRQFGRFALKWRLINYL